MEETGDTQHGGSHLTELVSIKSASKNSTSLFISMGGYFKKKRKKGDLKKFMSPPKITAGKSRPQVFCVICAALHSHNKDKCRQVSRTETNCTSELLGGKW